MPDQYQKIIIIGAPRSGTNMLRNTLVKLNGVGTWPCDEINYIWRYGNAKATTDEFTPAMASDRTKAYIQKSFDHISKKTGAETVVEKTCANSLRVSFVNEVVPEAKYIFIVRDGMDAISSSALRWRAKLDLPYLIKKSLYVPFKDVPYYGLKYLKSRLSMRSSLDGRQSYWGPKLKELDSSHSDLSLMKICAMQWKACVENAEKELGMLEADKVLKIKYEDFVVDPQSHVEDLSTFMGMRITDKQSLEAVSSIIPTSIGKGRQCLDEQTCLEIGPIITQTMINHGYQV